MNRMILEKERLMMNFKTAESYANYVAPHKLLLDQADAEIEGQKLRVSTISLVQYCIPHSNYLLQCMKIHLFAEH